MRNSVLRITGAMALVILGIWAGAKIHSSHNRMQGQRAMAVPAGEASPPNLSDLPPLQEGFLPPAKVPQQLPSFSLANRAGKSTSIGSFAGKSLIINFWATWCAPCRSEIPLLEHLHAEWSNRDVSVVGIAVDHRDAVLAFADHLKISYPLLIGEEDALSAAAAFGVESPVFPFTVFTDHRGEVVALFVGELHTQQAELILSQVQAINDNRLRLPDAQRAIAAGLEALKAS